MSIFTGSGVALCTPFTQDNVNYNVLSELIEFQIANGTSALVVCGTTGEPSTMTKEEKHGVIAHSVGRVNKRIPVIAGTGGNNTKAVIEDSLAACELGADALLLVTPYYNKCTPKGLIAHYFAVADAVDLPIIVYNVPARTGLNIAPDTLSKLAEHKNIVAMKEASGNISQIAEMCRLVDGKMDMYSGNDDQIIPLMSLNSVGVISVLANIAPKQTSDITNLYLSGKVGEAAKLQLELLPLINALFCEVNPIPVKTALRLMGYDMGELRAPLCEMEEKNLAALKTHMKQAGLI